MDKQLEKEERQYEELKKLGLKLKIPIPEMFLTLEVFDKGGKLIGKHHQRSHSWNRNAWNMLFSQFAAKDADDNGFAAGYISLKEPDGTVNFGDVPIYMGRGYANSVDGLDNGYRGPTGNDTWGIIVGSGTAAESFDGYAIQTKITNGTGGGQLSYVQAEENVDTYTPATKTWQQKVVRYFNNNSGGNVTVNEVALYPKSCFPSGGSVGSPWCISRDKLATGVTVPNTGQLKVTHTVQLTYPE